LRISQKFELFRDRYRRGDGGKSSGQDLQDATGGVVTRSYVSMLLEKQTPEAQSVPSDSSASLLPEQPTRRPKNSRSPYRESVRTPAPY
jgi:hypothetical protein